MAYSLGFADMASVMVFIMPKHEGRNDAFSFLVQYLKVAPKVIIYDFACELQNYCLNREPAFFKDTRFFVDGFHWYNHTACARSYDSKLIEDMRLWNTQLAEQCNSALKIVKNSVTRMSQGLFVSSLRLFLHSWNQKKLASLYEMQAYAERLLADGQPEPMDDDEAGSDPLVLIANLMAE